MKRISRERLVLALLALGAAGVAPNIFPAAQAGVAPMHQLATWLLLPSIALLIAVIAFTLMRGHDILGRRMVVGLGAGFLATFGLELVRTTSFRLGGMPGDLPRLLGVLITDRFMLGPSPLSDFLGYGYHFWNGATFGLIFAVIFGRRPIWWPTIYGIAIGAGFLASPAVQAMGVGFFAHQMPSMIVTVFVAHIVFGFIVGLLFRHSLPQAKWIWNDEPPAIANHSAVRNARSDALTTARE